MYLLEVAVLSPEQGLVQVAYLEVTSCIIQDQQELDPQDEFPF